MMKKIQYYDRVLLRATNSTELSDDPEMCIQIVPAHEADAAAGRISVDAPVAKAALYRKAGDTIAVTMLGQRVSMQIVSVEKYDPAA